MRLFRSMTIADDGLTAVGPTNRTLGVRPGIDMVVTGGMISTGNGGMSASPDSPLNLPRHRRPVEYGGTGKDPVWYIETSNLGAELVYRPDPHNPTGHGFIEPAGEMTLQAYQAAIEAIRDQWKLAEAEAKAE